MDSRGQSTESVCCPYVVWSKEGLKITPCQGCWKTHLMSSLHQEWMKTLHQMLKEKEVEKWISNSETITTDRVCSFWKKIKFRFNEHTHISSPKKYYQLKENLFEQSLLLVVLGGGEGCWLPNWKVGGQQHRRKGAFRVNPRFFPAAVAVKSPWLWAELHPLLCTNMNPHSVTVAVFGLTGAVAQGCPGGLGSACPHEMGFQFIIISYNKGRFFFLISI